MIMLRIMVKRDEKETDYGYCLYKIFFELFETNSSIYGDSPQRWWVR